MRPIDADALISDLEYDVDLDERALDCTDIVEPTRSTIQFDKDCKSNAIDLLKSMPTVEAIPVDFIESWIDSNMASTEDRDFYAEDCIRSLVQDWWKKNDK